MTFKHLALYNYYMPRKPRIHYPGAVYHVILRGNAGQNIFFDTADRYKYFHLLQEGIERFNHSIHAFCLMSNHVHLVIQANDIPLSRIMHNLNFRYTAYLNRRMKTSGHIFQGRYKAILVEADNYLLELIRYIHNNPVVAGIVMSPDNYRWSSHSVYIEKIDVTWLTTAWALSFFSKKRNRAIEKYQLFIKHGLTETPMDLADEVVEGYFLGSEKFINRIKKLSGQKTTFKRTIDEIIDKVCDNYNLEKKDVIGPGKKRSLSEARTMVAWIVRENKHLSLTDLSKIVKRTVSGLSSAVGRLEKTARNNSKLAGKMEKLKNTVLSRK